MNRKRVTMMNRTLMKHVSFLLVATTIRTVPVPALFMWLLAASGAAADPVKAFPAAEGFGANARGGRGGRVIEVTNLEDAGPGSLRAAMEASGPRIAVFRVSGTVTLTSA